jgi:hypothetical protein
MSNEEKSTHEKLIESLRLYFESHLKWETRSTYTASTEMRRYLSDIMKLAKQRRLEVQEKRRSTPKLKIPGNPQNLIPYSKKKAPDDDKE